MCMGGLAWILARPTLKTFIEPRDYTLRRNSWLILTFVVFVSPSIWLYFGAALVMVIWAAKRDSHPTAHYMVLLYAVPPVLQEIPAIGVNALFPVSNIRFLSLVLLLPLFIASREASVKTGNAKGVRTLDILVLSFCLLQIVAWQSDSLTALFRRSFLILLDTFVPYYTMSRLVASRRALTDIIATYCLFFLVVTPLAVFEMFRLWPLYGGIYEAWGIEHVPYTERAGLLRALVSTLHPLALGYLLSVALAFALFLSGSTSTSRLSKPLPYVIAIGLIATYSRGPWVAAAAGLLIYQLYSPSPLGNWVRSACLTGIVLVLLSLTPYWDRIIDSLPFIGTIEATNVEYRERLIETSIELIKQNPWFGDQHVIDRMDHMIQGQGIVDLVNGYVLTALYFGLTTLAILIGLLAQGYRLARRGVKLSQASGDTDSQRLGASLLAALVSSCVYLGTAGFEHVMWLLLGMIAAYSRQVQTQPLSETRPQRSRRIQPQKSTRPLTSDIS